MSQLSPQAPLAAPIPQEFCIKTAHLSDFVGGVRRVAMVGLAKNTGKTVAMTSVIGELCGAGIVVGVTSVGRDGEERDVIDIRIEKPRVNLQADSLIATTEGLVRSSGLPFELLEATGIRTPLGCVSVVRLLAPGAIEVAGPSTAADVRVVSEMMLAHGAEQVLIDGAIDRRAASSPTVTDGLVMSTGAVLGTDTEQVLAHTRDAVELVRLAGVSDPLLRALVKANRESLLVDESGRTVTLRPRFALSAGEAELAELLREHPRARHIVLQGALCEPFLENLLRVVCGRELELVVADATKVFLTRRSCGWYRRRGLAIAVLRPIRLLAITINPLAPGSHRLDSQHLRTALEEAIEDVPVLDVLDPAGRVRVAA